MIINVPVYLEIDGRFTPEEGRELTLYLRRSIVDFLRKQSGGFFTIDSEKISKRKVLILSEEQAVNRFSTGKRVKPISPIVVKPTDFLAGYGHNENNTK